MNEKELDINQVMIRTDFCPENLKPLEWQSRMDGKFFEVVNNPFFDFLLEKDERGLFHAKNHELGTTKIKNLVPKGMKVPYRGWVNWVNLSMCFTELDTAQEYIQFEYSCIIHHLIKALNSCEEHGFPKKKFIDEEGELEYFDGLGNDGYNGMVFFEKNHVRCTWLYKKEEGYLSPDYGSPEEAKRAFFKGTRELIDNLKK